MADVDMKIVLSISVFLIVVSLLAWGERFSDIRAQPISGQELNPIFWWVAVFSSYGGAAISLIVVFVSKRFRIIGSFLFLITMVLSPVANACADHLSRSAKNPAKIYPKASSENHRSSEIPGRALSHSVPWTEANRDSWLIEFLLVCA